MFEHNGIWLRPIEHRDCEFLRLMHNDWSTLKNLTDTSMITEPQQESWFSAISRSSTSSRLAVLTEINNEQTLVGCVRLDHIDVRNRSVMVGGDIEASFRGKGYGSKMFDACLKYVFDVMNMRRAYLLVLETNHIAKTMYLKHGFAEEGKSIGALFRDGAYFDYIHMYLFEDEYRRRINDTVV